MYHQVSRRPVAGFEKYTVALGGFMSQMAWLARSGHTPITLDRLLDARATRAPLPSRPVVITFDDTYRDCVDLAVPVMQARGFTATFYLVAGDMGATSRWLRRERGFELPLIDWSCARQLLAAGFHCGSHTVTHPRLADLPPEACRRELEDSRRLLEDRLDTEVRHLAYPFGSYDAGVREAAAEAGYRSACSVRIGLSPPDDDPLALHRVHVDGGDSLPDFVCKLRTARTVTAWLRNRAGRSLRRLRLIPERPGP
jgi:peptidoglycan/xylan/chitin deacetylase (PgdA/CDA1 family)